MNKGYARNEAYKLVQEMTLYGKKDLLEVLQGIKEVGHLTQKELDQITSMDRFLARTSLIFSRFGL
jgi:hypothetical protein